MERSDVLKITECLQRVYTDLGPGYPESVYRKACEIEFQHNNISYESEVTMPIRYRGLCISTVRADLIVEKKLIIELKAVCKISDLHITQTRRYLHHFDQKQAIVCNFPNTTESSNIETKVIEQSIFDITE